VLTGRSIKDAGTSFDGEWKVDVEFRNDDFVTNVATPYVGQRVAIVLDDQVVSAPEINEGITGRDVQITGSPFTEKEARDLALVLRYGSLPVQFDESETTRVSVSPSLGKDQLRAGIIAGVIGLALVALYMIFFYRLLGFVVWLGLALTGLIFFTLVSFLGDASGLTLTLSGVTGLIVSVGVTVDSYVVYFERLKDEVRSGKTIRSSLDVGFTRAFRTIVAADLVSLIGAAVLYFLAIGSVRGFAFFLGLSTIIDLFIAYFFMYPMVWFLARRPGLVRMRTMGVAAGLDVAGKVGV
jgi:preprotein translocase subunit SecD